MLSANDKTSTVIQVLIIQDTAFNTVHTWTGVIGQAGVRLVCPSDDSRLLLQQVNVLLAQIWRDDYRYQKGGVMLSEFTPKGQQQADLFAPSSAQSDALMAVMDQIKAKGLGRVGFASQGTGSPEWMMRQEHLSPCYTTRWKDLPVAR